VPHHESLLGLGRLEKGCDVFEQLRREVTFRNRDVAVFNAFQAGRVRADDEVQHMFRCGLLEERAMPRSHSFRIRWKVQYHIPPRKQGVDHQRADNAVRTGRSCECEHRRGRLFLAASSPSGHEIHHVSPPIMRDLEPDADTLDP
jgi:hypothetical protein